MVFGMRTFGLLFRFALYGFLTFFAFGYLLQNPYITGVPASAELMLTLGLLGALSFFASAGAALGLWGIFKELAANER